VFCDVLQEDVERLQGSLKVEYTLATVGAEKLWKLVHEEDFVPALGALTGNQAMQQIRAGLKAVYCSGWQVCLLPYICLFNITRTISIENGLLSIQLDDCARTAFYLQQSVDDEENVCMLWRCIATLISML